MIRLSAGNSYLKQKYTELLVFQTLLDSKEYFLLYLSPKKVIQSIASISGSGVLFVPASAGLVENTDRLMSASY